jgi:hypothetical protein
LFLNNKNLDSVSNTSAENIIFTEIIVFQD